MTPPLAPTPAEPAAPDAPPPSPADVEPGPARARRGRSSPLALVALALVTLAALAVRLHDLSAESIWADEALTLMIAREPLADVFGDVVQYEQIPPVHHLVIHFWIKAFGTSEASLRFPSVLASLACVPLLYLLVRRLTGAAGPALAAAALLAVSPFHVVYAQEARAYALLVLVALVATLAFLRLIDRPTRGREAAYVLASALVLYVHLYGAFALLAHHVAFAALWLADRRAGRTGQGTDAIGEAALTFRRWVVLNVAVAALFAPWVPIVLRWFRSVSINFWVKAVTWDDVSEAFRVYAGSTVALALSVPLLVLGVRRLWKQWRAAPASPAPAPLASPAERAALPLLVALLLLPVVIPVAVSVWKTPVFSPRYGIVASLALYALAGVGAASLRPGVLGAGAVLLLAALSAVARPVEPYKADWRAVGEYLAPRMGPRDIAVVHIKASARQYDYYVAARRPDVRRFGFDGSTVPVSLPLDEGKHVWLVLYGRFANPQTILDRGPWSVLQGRWFPNGIVVMELDDVPPATQPAEAAPATTNDATAP